MSVSDDVSSNDVSSDDSSSESKVASRSQS